MPLDLARRLGRALDVKSETRIRQIDNALTQYVRLTPQSPTVPSPGSIDASQVISGTFADARVAESNVTQHEGALAIDWMQLDNVPSTFPPSSHTHPTSDITSGTFADARIAQSNVTQHQAALSLAATQLTSGVLANARVQQSNVTQHEAALSIDWMQLDNVPATFPPSDHITTGTWTPSDQSGAGLSLTVYGASYVVHEKVVILRASLTYPATANTAQAKIGGFPHTMDANQHNCQAFVTYTNAGGHVYLLPIASTTSCLAYFASGGTARNVDLSGKDLAFTVIYTKT